MQVFSRLIELVSYPFQLLFAAPVNVLSASRRLRNFSLPARMALAVAVFMVLLTIVAVVMKYLEPGRPDFWTIWDRYTLGLIGLTLVTPPVVYLAVWFWLEGRGSRFPDIDQAWKEGMAALEKEGFAFGESPIFLLLGIRNERQARALMRASGLSFVVQGIPEGPNPLYFYAVKDYPLNKERWNPIFVVITDASQASKLNALASEAGRERVAKSIEDTVRPQDMRGTLADAGDGASSPSSAGDPMRGTVVAGSSQPAPLAATMGGGAMAGTLVVGQGANTIVASGQPVERQVVLDKREASIQAARLEHVGRLLAHAREPFCPLNGIMVVTPVPLMWRGRDQTLQLAHATRSDLRVIQRQTQLRCPVVSLLGGMEQSAGFGELVRRVGTGRAMEQRLGKGFETWNPPTIERMEALATHICGSIEDITYSLFKEQDGYNKPGNGKLYAMLCRARGEFAGLLKEFLANAYAQQGAHDAETPMLFTGCYFAATGEIERLQGFLKGVLVDKLLERQDDLQWTEDAQQQDSAFETWAGVGMLASGLLAVVTVALFLWLQFGR